jgi:hypothetical protein
MTTGMEAIGQSSDAIKGKKDNQHDLAANWVWKIREKEELRIIRLYNLFSVPSELLPGNLTLFLLTLLLSHTRPKTNS